MDKLSMRPLGIRGQKGQVHGGLYSFFWAFGGFGSPHVGSHPPWAAGIQEDLVCSSLLTQFPGLDSGQGHDANFCHSIYITIRPALLPCTLFFVSSTNLFMSPTSSSSVMVSLLNFCCSSGLQLSRALKAHPLDMFTTLPKMQHKPLLGKVCMRIMNTQFAEMLDSITTGEPGTSFLQDEFRLHLWVKHPPAMRKTWIWSLGWEDPLEKGTATHSSILSGLDISMDRGAWRATVCGITKSQTQLSD